jgi:signal transduction histidine kinase
VRDQGIGISAVDRRDKLFNPFTKFENGLTLNPNGIGLGLKFCKDILDKLGGKIWAPSSFLKSQGHLNHGSTFCFKMRFYRADPIKK